MAQLGFKIHVFNNLQHISAHWIFRQS